MAYNVLLTRSAENDLDEIIGYIMNDLCNPTAAAALLDAIAATYAHLSETPHMYALCQAKLLSPSGYRKAVIRGYLMIYRIDEERQFVYVERFFSDLEDFEHNI